MGIQEKLLAQERPIPEMAMSGVYFVIPARLSKPARKKKKKLEKEENRRKHLKNKKKEEKVDKEKKRKKMIKKKSKKEKYLLRVIPTCGEE